MLKIFRSDLSYSKCADFRKQSYTDFRDSIRAKCDEDICVNHDNSIWPECLDYVIAKTRGILKNMVVVN